MKYLILFLLPVLYIKQAFSAKRPSGSATHFFKPFDNSIAKADTTDPTDTKVIISAGANNLEFTPLSSFNNGLLIQPVNRSTQAAVPAAFYTSDTSSWSFFTKGIKRLSIDGAGYISASARLLINNAEKDGVSSLRVNGQARFDSAISIKAQSDTAAGFISMHRNMKSIYHGEDDGISPYSTTPDTWAAGKNIPVFRLRHPNNTTGNGSANSSVKRDFLILPYQYGTAIEYNGVVECWVGEWSIHKGFYYTDIEGKGNGWGAVFWIGDDQDLGGVRGTARNNLHKGGNVNYGELSVEKFGGTPNGDFRFRLPSNQNQFHFIYGERGSTNIVAKVSDKGFFIPKGSSPATVTAPEKGQVYFDSTNAEFKGYNGSQWVSFSNSLITGTTTQSSNGSSTFYLIPHGFGTTPAYFNVIATSNAAGSIKYVTADSDYLRIFYNTAPPAGANNLSWNWQIKK